MSPTRPARTPFDIDFPYFFDRAAPVREATLAAMKGLIQGGLDGERGEMSLALYGDLVRCGGETPREIRKHLQSLREGDIIAALDQAREDVSEITVPTRFYIDDHQLALDVKARDRVESLMIGCRYARRSQPPHEASRSFWAAYEALSLSLETLDEQWCLAVFEDDEPYTLDDLLGARRAMSREWI